MVIRVINRRWTMSEMTLTFPYLCNVYLLIFICIYLRKKLVLPFGKNERFKYLFYLCELQCILHWFHYTPCLICMKGKYKQRWLSNPLITPFHLSWTEFTEHKKTATYSIGNPGPTVGQGKKYGGAKPTIENIRTLPHYNWIYNGNPYIY